MLSLGMRLPRKEQNKTRTLHVLCALMHGCVFGVHNMVVMCCDCLCD